MKKINPISNYSGNIKKLIEYPKQGIFSKHLVKGKHNITLFCMARETEIEEHTSTKEGFVYILEGKGLFTLEGKEIKMLPNVFIHMNKNAVHSLKVNINTSFLLYLFN